MTAKTHKRTPSNTTIGFMIGVPIAIICIAIIVASVSGSDPLEFKQNPMKTPIYDQPAYAANTKAPKDVDFTNSDVEFISSGNEITISPENKNDSATSNNVTYTNSQYSGVYTDESSGNKNNWPDSNRTPAEETAGEIFENTQGKEGTPTRIVERDGNDISDQIWKDDNITTYNSFTVVDEVADAGGKLGNISIPAINLSVGVYQSETSEIEAMSRGVAHFNSTSSWDGNVGLCGHNWTESGNGAYFKDVNQLKKGDTITYTTRLGTRTYKISSITTIDQSDWSYLARTDDNRLTLITCTFNDNSKRLCVQAVAI